MSFNCSLKNSDIILEFANPENAIVLAKNVSLPCTELINIFLSKYGCHGNAVCFIENSDSILLFADPKNPRIHS